MRPPMELRKGDVVVMRKPHPCGGSEWRIERLGADIGAVCLTCHRYILMPRSRFEPKIKRFLERGPEIAEM
ncbi:MAG: DUF951 domain-containing protein [Anaerolineae bacterium]|nr:DUF951 domain-containing protein [Anaerolineae bacterium]